MNGWCMQRISSLLSTLCVLYGLGTIHVLYRSLPAKLFLFKVFFDNCQDCQVKLLSMDPHPLMYTTLPNVKKSCKHWKHIAFCETYPHIYPNMPKLLIICLRQITKKYGLFGYFEKIQMREVCVIFPIFLRNI